MSAMSIGTVARRVVLVAVVLAATAACGGDDDSASPGGGVGQRVGVTTTTAATETTAPPAPTRTLEGVTVGLREVAAVEAPIDLTSRAGDPALYVAERGGRVRRIDVTTRTNGSVTFQLERSPVLDIGDEVLTDGERGLLGIAFSADGRKLYFAFTGTDANQHLDEITMEGDEVESSSRRRLMDVPDFASNHNGGDARRRARRLPLLGMGDGGGGGDPENTGQDPNDLLGLAAPHRPGGRDRGAARPTPSPTATRS